MFQKIAKVIGRDFQMLAKSKLPLDFRLLYPFQKYTALMRNNRRLNYLGRRIRYDNWSIPISIQHYPVEILYRVLSNIEKTETVLDVGGNLGQFALTLNHFSPKSEIHVFEPNPKAFEMLTENCKNLEQIKLYDYGIGPNSESEIYFNQNQTAAGSLIQNNENQEKSTIKLTNEIEKLTGRAHFDLIKIDVEGYELEVIKNLADISCNALYIEIDTEDDKAYDHSELFNELEKSFGEFNIAFQQEISDKKRKSNLLIKFK